MKEINFDQTTGLVPAIVEHINTRQTLMLGYLNKESLDITLETGWVTFYSRSKEKLWTKGETSGNKLKYISHAVDCDRDTILVRVLPSGPACHTGDYTCWGEEKVEDILFLNALEDVIKNRRFKSTDASYVHKLMRKGINKVAQKLGEEAVEVIIEAKDNDDEKFINEAADLLFHFLVLLNMKEKNLSDVVSCLESRNKRE